MVDRLTVFSCIYRSLFIQSRGALKKELLEHLRRTRVMRRARNYTLKTSNLGKIVDTVSISDVPLPLKIGPSLAIGKLLRRSVESAALSRH